MAIQPIISAVNSVRRSPVIVVVVVFVAMMLDLVMLTTLEPILPGIIYDIEHAKDGKQLLSLFNHSSTSTQPQSNSSNINNEPISRDLAGTTNNGGIVLAMKPGVEIFTNIAVGFIVEKYAHKTPMIMGCFFNILATLGFAYSTHIWMLIVARIIQAIGSSLSVVSGLALIATVFTNDADRTWANSIAFGGLSFGILIGFPLGSTCYQFLGRASPFLILAALTFMDGMLRMLIIAPDRLPSQEKDGSDDKSKSGFFKLFLDPYILLAIGCNLLQHIGLGMVVATQSAWMMSKFSAEPWVVGVVLVVGSLFQFITQIIIGNIAVKTGRWFFCWLGLILSAAGYIAYPFCDNVWLVIAPESLCRTGLGAILAALSPLMAFIADLRHNSQYGHIYGLYAASYNLGLVIGPVAGGMLMHVIGFHWMYWSVGTMFALYSFLCIYFKKLETNYTQENPEEEKLLGPDASSYGSTTVVDNSPSPSETKGPKQASTGSRGGSFKATC